ncbi:MAG: hypothetical protein WB791_01855 [Waddliaceae bacterium]
MLSVIQDIESGTCCEQNPDVRIPFPHSYELHEDPISSHMLAYLAKLKIRKLFEKLVTDPRRGQSTYTLSSLLLTALFNVQFLSGSKNSFHTQAHEAPKIKERISMFIGRGDGALPVAKTIDDVLEKLDFEEFNNVLMQLFENFRLSKTFFEHDELIPGGEYHIALDGEKIHTYSPDSGHDCESCPYCLKRTRGDTTWYCHMIVVASLVCPGGFKLPIYVYPIRSQAIHGKETSSDDVHKQECELSALKVIIPRLRERFPGLRMCALLDSLFANGPTLDLLENNRFSYAIVRKKGSMPSVRKDCDGLLKLPDYENSHTAKRNFTVPKGSKVQQKVLFFNKIDYQERKINLLRFYEVITSPNGKERVVYWEWIVSWKVTQKNGLYSAERGRLRWHEEDLFNTAENRGYAIEHDYSRDCRAQKVWVLLIMIALFINECFTHTRSMRKRRKNLSIKDFLKNIFSELRCLPFETIFAASILHKRTQFRYWFDTGPPL